MLHWIFRACEFGIAFCLIQIVKRSSRKQFPSNSNRSENISYDGSDSISIKLSESVNIQSSIKIP